MVKKWGALSQLTIYNRKVEGALNYLISEFGFLVDTNYTPDPIFDNNGSQIPQNGKFYNIYQSDLPNLAQRSELTKINNEWMVNVNGNMQTPREGAYTFVTQDGKIYIGEGRDPYHIDLSGGSAVDYAGELQLSNVGGKIEVTEWSNSSGHYKPIADYKEQSGLSPATFRDASQWFIF
ncbi:MAG: hypothetical protein HC849_30920 [Oscillatoriales cyanobacterium RU_3_3]|nr:hypothetical protein [Microcoleus sp. SU_5_6]NJL66779.1 hypothetical protein [Microcoleus sp. SM1_3_4]NJM63581.1 hypothetical protein [Oscillatoriales cyanobacterium RU_3_3]NJR25746.1 hypothetical protein [Richelia sp. CSU_2_1]NJS42126.1 hypothetical protein [Candidatus Gracilibacteria bacterium]